MDIKPRSTAPATAKADRTNIEQAQGAYDLGFCVIPLREREKKPAVKYKHILESKKRPTIETTVAQLEGRPERNVGVLLGELSGGILAVDFDDIGQYRKWSQENPELANWLPTVRTKDGFHVYFQPIECFTGSHDLRCYGTVGEIKGNGALTVYPGSTVDGHEYSWVVPPSKEEGIPRTSLVQSGLVPNGFISSIATLQPQESSDDALDTDSTALSGFGTEHNRALPSIAEQNQAARSTTDSIPPTTANGIKFDLENIKDFSIVSSGQRNRTLWALACRLVNKIGKAQASQSALDIHDHWWRLYGDHCTTDFETSAEEFLSMVTRVDLSSSFLLKLTEQYMQEPLPSFAQMLPKTDRHLAVCRLLACADRLADHGVFFLSMQTISDLCGFKSKRAVSALLPTLTKGICVLEIVEKGNTRRANRYRLVVNADGSIRDQMKN